MESLDQLLEECERLHGHMCAGQLLGARMAMLGCQLVGLKDPRGADRKKLIVWVEIIAAWLMRSAPSLECVWKAQLEIPRLWKGGSYFSEYRNE